MYLMVTSVVGLNWGDEGKGRMVDYFAGRADCVIRYQGGDNAGHTVVNDHGKFAFHNFPSGVCYPGVINIIASGSVRLVLFRKDFPNWGRRNL